MKLLVLAFAFAALSPSFAAPGKTVAVDHPYLKVLVETLTGNQLKTIIPVENLKDPHHHRPTLSQVGAFVKADFIISSPSTITPWMLDIVPKAKGKKLVLKSTGKSENDHYWLNPTQICSTLNTLAIKLQQWMLDIKKTECNSQSLVDKFSKLAQRFQDKVLLVSHASVVKFLRQSGFKTITIRKSDHHHHFSITEVKKMTSTLKHIQNGVYLRETSVALPGKVEEIIKSKKFKIVSIDTFNPPNKEIFGYLEVLYQRLSSI